VLLTGQAAPAAAADRIESLDVVRGFAVLGILLLNIIGFGLPASAYSNPATGFSHAADPWVWAGIEILAEGTMRCLFSMLFGAGVVLFTAAGKGALLHYRRSFWLLLFGLFDAYVLLWSGDILITYAVAGAVLYMVRNAQPRQLLAAAIALLVLLSVMHVVTDMRMSAAKQAAAQVTDFSQTGVPDPEILEQAQAWSAFTEGLIQDEGALSSELAARRHSYVAAFAWNAPEATRMLTVVLPWVLFWDALAMMLLGMALYKYGILQARRSRSDYRRLMICGFAVGLLVNGYEVMRAFSADFALLSVFAQVQPTYHLGRVAMALGYVGLIALVLQSCRMARTRRCLAAVGRMALSNYLLQSLLCLFIFTGAGMSLVGELHRWQLYGVVVAIWAGQLAFSPWWLSRYRFGPVEWLWRGLTYGNWPALRYI
jgi:uncharacterized protein